MRALILATLLLLPTVVVAQEEPPPPPLGEEEDPQRFTRGNCDMANCQAVANSQCAIANAQAWDAHPENQGPQDQGSCSPTTFTSWRTWLFGDDQISCSCSCNGAALQGNNAVVARVECWYGDFY